MKKIFATVVVVFRWMWKVLRTGTMLTTNLIFLFSLVFLLSLIFFHPQVHVPDDCALILAPEGTIVEQRSTIDAFTPMLNKLTGNSIHDETPLQDILDVINTAAEDTRIKILVILPSKLKSAGLNQLRDIGEAIEQFKKKGKIVIASGDTFSQSQYYLASYADEIYLNPMGRIDLHGFGVFRLYYRTLLDKLSINFHVFRVGTFKSAIEPLLRDNMSTAAKEANQQWLVHLWSIYCQDISKQRGLPPEVINNFINQLDFFLRKAKGDAAVMALNTGLIDGLKTQRQLEDYLSSVVGRDSDSSGFKHIGFYDYLETVTPSFTMKNTESPRVGIIVAQGTIVNGKGAVGQIGASGLVKQIQLARLDKRVKAIVLRIDSGGGSAFASEQIRQELALSRNAGKPVVISMGSVAASGAYWLSADADAILASAVTLTGSIGIFGAIPTIEKSLSRIGISNDGTGTTVLADGVSPTRGLSPVLSRALQLGVEQGYRKFIDIVATGRKLSVSKVETIAEGRVWDGTKAMELGLVDEIGSLAEAVSRAANLAGIAQPNGQYIDTPSTTILENLQKISSKTLLTILKNNEIFSSPLVTLGLKVMAPFAFLYQQSDPGNLYAHSLLSSSTIDF